MRRSGVRSSSAPPILPSISRVLSEVLLTKTSECDIARKSLGSTHHGPKIKGVFVTSASLAFPTVPNMRLTTPRTGWFATA